MFFMLNFNVHFILNVENNFYHISCYFIINFKCCFCFNFILILLLFYSLFKGENV